MTSKTDYWKSVKSKANRFVSGQGLRPMVSWKGLAGQVSRLKGERLKFKTKGKARGYLGRWAKTEHGISHTNLNHKVRRTTDKKAEAKTFYSSWEWKKARFEILKRYGPVCMLCGSEDRIVVDHIKPRSKFPELELDLDNLQVLCNDCNMGKSNDDYTDFRPDGLTNAELDELEIISESPIH